MAVSKWGKHLGRLVLGVGSLVPGLNIAIKMVEDAAKDELSAQERDQLLAAIRRIQTKVDRLENLLEGADELDQTDVIQHAVKALEQLREDASDAAVAAVDAAVDAAVESHGITFDEFEADPDAAVMRLIAALKPHWPLHAVDVSSMAVVKNFTGRALELKQLRAAIRNGKSVITLTGLGGQGKSSVIGRWYQRDRKKLADRAVFWYRPYEAGNTYVRFLTDILPYFLPGVDPRELPQDTKKQTKILIELLRARPTLLVLDGVERWLNRWQHDRDATGEQVTVNDRGGATAGLDDLLADAATWTNGSCLLLTSRALPAALDRVDHVTIGDNKGERASDRQMIGLEVDDGIRLLRKSGVTTADGALLEQAVKEYAGHSLALSLLGSLVAKQYGGDITQRPSVIQEDDLEHLLKKVAVVHEDENALLSVIACSVGAAPVSMLAEVTRPEETAKPDEPAMRQRLAHLADWQLVEFSDDVDMHPLVRKFFRSRLTREPHQAIGKALAGWHAAQSIPDGAHTLEEVAPRIRAIEQAIDVGLYEWVDYLLYSRLSERRSNSFIHWLVMHGYLELQVDLCGSIIDVMTGLEKVEDSVKFHDALAGFHGSRAYALRVQGNLSGAISDYGRAVELYDQLVSGEGRTELRNDLAMAYNNRGNALRAQGDLPGAISDYGRAVELLEQLVTGEGRTELRNDLAMAYNNRGNALRAQGDLPGAISDFGRAVELYEQLVTGEGRSELRNDLAKAYNNRGNALDDHGDLPGAISDFGRAVELYDQLVSGEGRVKLVGDWAETLVNRALTFMAMEEIEDAREDMGRGVAFLHEAVSGGRVDLLASYVKQTATWCDDHERLGLTDEVVGWCHDAIRWVGENQEPLQSNVLLQRELVRFLRVVREHQDALLAVGLEGALFEPWFAAMD